VAVDQPITDGASTHRSALKSGRGPSSPERSSRRTWASVLRRPFRTVRRNGCIAEDGTIGSSQTAQIPGPIKRARQPPVLRALSRTTGSREGRRSRDSSPTSTIPCSHNNGAGASPRRPTQERMLAGRIKRSSRSDERMSRTLPEAQADYCRMREHRGLELRRSLRGPLAINPGHPRRVICTEPGSRPLEKNALEDYFRDPMRLPRDFRKRSARSDELTCRELFFVTFLSPRLHSKRASYRRRTVRPFDAHLHKCDGCTHLPGPQVRDKIRH